MIIILLKLSGDVCMNQNKQKALTQTVGHSWLYISTLVLTLAGPFVLGRVAHADTVATSSSESIETTTQANHVLTEKTAVIAGTSAAVTETSPAQPSSSQATSEVSQQGAATSQTSANAASADSATSQVGSQQSQAPAAATTQQNEQSPATDTTQSAVNNQPSQAAGATSPKPVVAAVSMNKVASRAAMQPATVTDDQVVNFTDSNLAAQVRTSLKLAANADITVGAIRNYTGQTVAIGTESKPIVVTSLTGMAAFENLPVTKNLNLYVYLANPQGQADLRASGFDLTPLENVQFNELGLYTQFFAMVDVTPLTKLNVDKLRYYNLQPDYNITANYHAATNANYGLTNAQLKQLAPTIIAMSNNQVKSWKMVQLADNALTDFSVLSGINITTDMRIFAVGQAAINYKPINIVAGQPLTYTADEQLGINGEILHVAYDQSNVITPVYTYDDAGNITSVTWTPAQYLGNNQFYIAAPVENAPTFYHGQWGYLGHSADTNYYTSKYYAGYNGLQLMTDAMIFRPTNWQTSPSITVNFVDRQTGQVIQTQTVLGANKTIGETEDLTPLTTIKDYHYVGASVSDLKLTYSADPQTVNLYFAEPRVRAQGIIQVNYVDDTTGTVLTVQTATGEQGSQSDYATATTIQAYLKQGYLLVSDEYPSAGATYTEMPEPYTVHFKHGTTTVSDQKVVTETIHYVYEDGTQAAPDKQVTITFDRTGSQDQVTNTVTWHNWTSTTAQFDAQVSPTITNYIAKPSSVAAVDGITPTSQDIEMTVTYTQNKATSTSTDDDVVDPGTPKDQAETTQVTKTTALSPAVVKATKTGQSVEVGTVQPAAGQPNKLRATNRQTMSVAAKSQTEQQRLPQTAETATSWLALAGVGLMALLSAIGIVRKH